MLPTAIASGADAFGNKAEPFVSIEFDTLEGFEPVLFPKIPTHTEYSIEHEDGNNYLVAYANSSASGLLWSQPFDVYEYPVVSWRWRVSNVFKKGHAGIKSGDDFPARLYVMFAYDPKEALLGQRIIYATLKAFYGKYPPLSTLNFVWASRAHQDRYLTSPYTGRSMLVILRQGQANEPEAWALESVNVLDGYREAFRGNPPPRMARLAVMADADNTGESATAHFDSITVSPAP